MKILLVQLSWLGDCVLSTPLIQTLKEGFVDSQVHVLTTPLARSIFEANPLVDNVLTYDKRGSERGIWGLISTSRRIAAMRFDRVYSLHRSGRTALMLACSGIPDRVGFENSSCRMFYTRTKIRPRGQHEVLRNLALLSGECENVMAEMSVFAEPGVKAPAVIDAAPVVLFPSSSWYTKQWKGFRSVAEYFLRRQFQVVILGAPSEKAYNAEVMSGLQVVDLTGATSISETIEIVRRASLVVCNDSFSLHLASAFKRPNVVVFCATSPDFGFGPWRNPYAEVVEMEGLDCRPCGRHGGKFCPTGTEKCMLVPPGEVLKRCEEVMARFSARELS